MQTVQQPSLPFVAMPTSGSNDQFGGMGGLTGLILGGALFGRNGGLFGGNGDAGVTSVATNNALDSLNARFNDLSQQNQSTAVNNGFSELTQQITSFNIASQQQSHANAMEAQKCCCEAKVAVERTNANIAATEARLGLQICQSTNETNRLIESSKTEILMTAKDNIVANLQNQIQQQSFQAIQNQMNNGFNNLANAVSALAQSLTHKGNGNG